MYTSCLVCHAAFPDGALVEHLPVGRRVAYDPERGRLWVICDACSGWTLAPIAQRWEALEELEQLVTSRRRRVELAGRTDNISLFRARGGDIIRVGPSTLTEEAAWRYGRPDGEARGANPFAPRRLRLGEFFLGSAYAVRTAFSASYRRVDYASVRRWVRFGDTAWRGPGRCAGCGTRIERLTFFDARRLILQDGPGEGLTPALTMACPRCKDEVTGGLHLQGVAAEAVLRRVLAHRQDQGVPQAHLNAAAHLIELGGGSAGLSSILARYGRYLGDLPITSAVALRVLANDAYERRLLDLEAAFIERRWEEEEELASIIDGDLTHVPSLEAMRQDMRRIL